MGPQSLHVVSQMDMTKLSVAICNCFANAPKNMVTKCNMHSLVLHCMQETLQLLHLFDLTSSGNRIMPHAQLSTSAGMTPKSFKYISHIYQCWKEQWQRLVHTSLYYLQQHFIIYKIINKAWHTAITRLKITVLKFKCKKGHKIITDKQKCTTWMSDGIHVSEENKLLYT